MSSEPKTLKQRAGQVIKPLVRATGYELVKHHFYGSLPDVKGLPAALWIDPIETVGLDLRTEAALRFLQHDLRPYLAEFHPPRYEEEPGEFYLDNGTYGAVDAEVLYAMIRHTKPKRVFEFGSGATSHIIATAALVNDSEGHPLGHEIFDPYPFTASPLGAVSNATVRSVRAEDIDAVEMDRLGSGDVLFVDTTHTVKTGGDVTRIFLHLIPRLASGTWIHVHDIFLPYEYPREWVVERRRAWAEQYLLQAFLAFNDAFEVVFPAHAVARTAPKALSESIPSFPAGFDPSAFWMRRV